MSFYVSKMNYILNICGMQTKSVSKLSMTSFCKRGLMRSTNTWQLSEEKWLAYRDLTVFGFRDHCSSRRKILIERSRKAANQRHGLVV